MIDETTTVTIEKLVEGGWGLARRDAEVVLLRGVVSGETVRIEGQTKHKGYSEARVGAVLDASPHRIAPPCPVFGLCGGCQLQHVRYEAQLAEKRAVLQETLRRVGKLTIDDIPLPIASPEPFGYRSTVRFLVFKQDDRFRLGFHRERSHEPVEGAHCLLAPPQMREVAALVTARLEAEARLPVRVHSLEMRRSWATGALLLMHRTGTADRARADRLMARFRDLPGVVGQVVTAGDGKRTKRWSSGQDWIEDRLCGLTFRISDRSFMQANWPVNEIMARCVGDWVGPSPGLRILELYAGIGTLGLPLARQGAYVTEVESNPHALKDARHAAKHNHVGRCRFRNTSAEAMLQGQGQGQGMERIEYDVVLADPPRTGLSEACLRRLAEIQIPRLLYLSCDSSTLARDLSRLCAGGYSVGRVQPFDMFPQTAHLETLVELVGRK